MSIITIPSAGQYGLAVDQPAQELPVNAWSRVENMRFRNGSAERMAGHAPAFAAPAVTPYFVSPYQSGISRRWVHCGLSAVYVDEGTTRTNITGPALTGTSTDRWTGAVLGGVLMLNNSVDQPMYYAGTGTLATLPGWNSAWRCKSVGAFKAFGVAINITKSGQNYPHMVKWSHPVDPGAATTSWDETDTTKQAGEVDLAETTDPIVDQLPLGDANIIYKERSMYSMRFIGGTQIFEFRRLPGSFGMLAPGCAAITPKGHVVLAAGDLVVHDGVSEPQSIISDKLRSWLFTEQIDATSFGKCFVTANPSRSEVWVCYPEVGRATCTKALAWNWDSNTFGLRDLPDVNHAASGAIDYSASGSWGSNTETWAEATTLWGQSEFSPTEARLVMASAAPALYLADSGSNFNGAGVVAVLERTGLAFDAPEVVKTIKSISPRIDAPAGTVVQITVGASMDAEVPPTWGAPVAYTVGTSYKADAFATGRFLSVRFSSTSGARWSVKSYSADITQRGLF